MENASLWPGFLLTRSSPAFKYLNFNQSQFSHIPFLPFLSLSSFSHNERSSNGNLQFSTFSFYFFFLILFFNFIIVDSTCLFIFSFLHAFGFFFLRSNFVHNVQSSWFAFFFSCLFAEKMKKTCGVWGMWVENLWNFSVLWIFFTVLWFVFVGVSICFLLKRKKKIIKEVAMDSDN